MQYICSEKPMRWPDKVTALHPFTHRIVFVTAPHCLCHRTALSLLTHRIAFFRSLLIFLSSCHAELVSASVRGDVLEMARCEILKQVQDDICVLTSHCSPLTSHNSSLTAHCSSPICQKTRKRDFGVRKENVKDFNILIIKWIQINDITPENTRKKDLSVSGVSLKSFWKNT